MVESPSILIVIISHQPKKSLARQPGLPPASSRAQQSDQKWFILQSDAGELKPTSHPGQGDDPPQVSKNLCPQAGAVLLLLFANKWEF